MGNGDGGKGATSCSEKGLSLKRYVLLLLIFMRNNLLNVWPKKSIGGKLYFRARNLKIMEPKTLVKTPIRKLAEKSNHLLLFCIRSYASIIRRTLSSSIFDKVLRSSWRDRTSFDNSTCRDLNSLTSVESFPRSMDKRRSVELLIFLSKMS